ncbi:MAG: hypothetical protein A3J54_03235 [Candidatus Ryanbacteria bacterium RIFCSPHIGHO2_02_FULL_45_13b]|uniref:Uncharacterized protein n=1 Tax=Candidatus Ryanbacteria bacterium RIFCSPHIGHO2_02_FULL_45_13b TaxID=1802117 RepID=A0A1G2G542_9BACT|nr:MAG: hypothetical protein A3J54_03235 [Candidatus Ryanbacteria bacterium RIFCSPHIGHO2_02_FULL_45_13b]
MMQTMNKTNLKKTSPLGIKSTDLARIYRASTELPDSIEDILENNMAYTPAFRRALERSIAKATRGQLTPLRSLTDLR